jgi:hypothetical protein
LAFAAWVIGCSKPSDTGSSSAPAVVVSNTGRPLALGERGDNGVFQLRVLRTKTCSVEPHFQPPAGVRKLGVEVELAAVTDAQVPANPFYAQVSDERGQRYEPTLAGCTPPLEAARLDKDEKVSGWITFDVPETLGNARFSYAPVVIGVGKPELSADLPP